MKTIVFFNNKGGVGKTTLTCNVAAYLNMKCKKRVLLIDADPQCNATQALLTDEVCEQIYIEKREVAPTLFDYLAPIEAGEPSLRTPVRPMSGKLNLFETDLIPGHPQMSLVEDKLSAAWGQFQGGTPAGARVTNWCSQLYREVENQYDILVFDVGPSLGALNRTVILSSDYLVTPFGSDIFSLLGIQNIASWLGSWKRQYDRAIEHMRTDRPEVLQQYPIITDTEGKFRFAGYSVQQYVTRSFRTGKRPVKAYDRIMNQIPESVNQNMEFLRPQGLTAEELELAHVPFLYSLVPLAQAARCPIHALRRSTKLVGNQFQQVEEYSQLMHVFCQKLLHNIGLP